MHEHVKTVCKHTPHIEQPLQFRSRYYLKKPLMSNREEMINIRFRRRNEVNICLYVFNFYCLKGQIDPTRDLIKWIQVIIMLSKLRLVLSTLSCLWLWLGLPFTSSISLNLIELWAVLSDIIRLKNTRRPKEQENTKNNLGCNFCLNTSNFSADPD